EKVEHFPEKVEHFPEKVEHFSYFVKRYLNVKWIFPNQENFQPQKTAANKMLMKKKGLLHGFCL
ncbi:MAG: hypothetical protein WCQ95_12185, partial [Bacteroidota bacterium]